MALLNYSKLHIEMGPAWDTETIWSSDQMSESKYLTFFPCFNLVMWFRLWRPQICCFRNELTNYISFLRYFWRFVNSFKLAWCDTEKNWLQNCKWKIEIFRFSNLLNSLKSISKWFMNYLISSGIHDFHPNHIIKSTFKFGRHIFNRNTLRLPIGFLHSLQIKGCSVIGRTNCFDEKKQVKGWITLALCVLKCLCPIYDASTYAAYHNGTKTFFEVISVFFYRWLGMKFMYIFVN